jgi:hypothetical protein
MGAMSMITYMTPSRIEYEFSGESYTVHGEALNPEVGGLDYVIYAPDFHFTDPARRDAKISPLVHLQVLEGIKSELTKKGTRFEVDDEDVVLAMVSEHPRVEANQPCVQAGWYFTPAKTDSRRYFKKDELMPKLQTDYGDTYWLWDKDQGPPKI